MGSVAVSAAPTVSWLTGSGALTHTDRLKSRRCDTEQLGSGEFTVEVAGLHVQGLTSGCELEVGGMVPRTCS